MTCDEGRKSFFYATFCTGNIVKCPYCGQKVCTYHRAANTTGMKGGHSDCTGPECQIDVAFKHMCNGSTLKECRGCHKLFCEYHLQQAGPGRLTGGHSCCEHCETSPIYANNCKGIIAECKGCGYKYCEYHYKPCSNAFTDLIGGHVCDACTFGAAFFNPENRRIPGLGWEPDESMLREGPSFKPFLENKPRKSVVDFVAKDCGSVLHAAAPFLHPSAQDVCCMVNAKLKQSQVKEYVQEHQIEFEDFFAITMYTYDLCLLSEKVDWDGNKEACFYRNFNSILQECNPEKNKQLHCFLYHLLSGLNKLPCWSGALYRGISNGDFKDILIKNCKKGIRVWLHGMSSATPSLAIAQHFAESDGVILKMKVRSGRDIRIFSAFDSEDEVLLGPKFGLLVVEEIHFDPECDRDVIAFTEL